MKTWVILLCLVCAMPQARALQLDSPPGSSQFISYWKSYVISAQQDPRVAGAERVFKRLLRSWDSARLEPGLFVVDADKGPWAASLVDGNILLSRQALDTLQAFGEARSEQLLAFVLAHELSHQRADDLWQHRFFRNGQAADADLRIDLNSLKNLEQQEARADHDALILMSSVGFNPYVIVGEKDFFTQWVESLWRQPCDHQRDSLISEACQQAKTRALRARYQLDNVASQSSLYELGLHALVANRFQRARYFFTQYGRNVPNRAVMSALGISLLAQAIQQRNGLINEGLIDAPILYYPLMLDSAGDTLTRAEAVSGAKRSARNGYLKQQRQQISTLLNQAAGYFQKAIQLQPDYRNSYILLANAYLADENSFLARGVLQGRYQPRFGPDRSSSLLLAMTDSLEGKHEQAIESLRMLAQSAPDAGEQPAINEDLLLYSLNRNLTALLSYSGQPEQATKVWINFARQMQGAGKAMLFQLALGQLNPVDSGLEARLKQAPSINGQRLGNKKIRDDSAHSINELWIEGEQYHVYNYFNGALLITDSGGSIISAEQQGGSATLDGVLKSGDDAGRAIRALGNPDRRIQLLSGAYLAYDRYGLALRIDEDEIKGWFLY